MIIIEIKLKCCQYKKGVYCCNPTSATISMKQIQSPSDPNKPLVALNYQQVESSKISHARCNWTTYFCNSPSFTIIGSGLTETIIDMN